MKRETWSTSSHPNSRRGERKNSHILDQPWKLAEVDRIKKYYEADPLVTPSPNFDGNLKFNDPDLEYIKFDNKKDLRLKPDKDKNYIVQETEVVTRQASWLPPQEHLPSTNSQPAMLKRIPLSKVANMKLQRAARQAQHQAGCAKQTVSLPAPPLMHACQECSKMQRYKHRLHVTATESTRSRERI